LIIIKKCEQAHSGGRGRAAPLKRSIIHLYIRDKER
jgi:hypothetical protein